MLARTSGAHDRNDDGFTLVELLVVIVIIGILAAIAIPVFLNQRKKGFEASMKSDLRSVATEEETYFHDYQRYTAPSGPTSAATAGTTATVGIDTIATSAGNYLGNTGTAANFGTTGFCLIMKSTKSPTATFVYDSTRGGLQPSTVSTCTGTYS